MTKTTAIHKVGVRQAQAKAFRDIVLGAMIQLRQPATISEVQQYVGRELNKEFNEPRIRYAFEGLIAEGKLVQRLETDAERALRFNGRTVFAGNATLYYPAILGDTVPPRTVASIAPGIELIGRTMPWGRVPGTKNRKKTRSRAVASKSARGAAPKVTVTPGATIDTDALDFLVEKLVASRTQKLQHELDDARTQLAAIRSMLK